MTSPLCDTIGTDRAETLAKHRIRSVEDLLSCDPKSLSRRTGLEKSDCEEIFARVVSQYCSPFSNGLDIQDAINADALVLETGCDSIDEMLNGGLYTGEVVEINGASAVGKTQVCLTAVFHTCANSHATALYFDTTRGFSVERLCEIFSNRSPDPSRTDILDEILSKIVVVPCDDASALLQGVTKLQQQIAAGNLTKFFSSLRLVVIDSIASVISPILSRNPNGHTIMMQLGRAIQHIATDAQIAFLLTNEVRASGQAALGESWLSVCHHRITLTELDKTETNCTPKDTHPKDADNSTEGNADRQIKAQLVKSVRLSTVTTPSRVIGITNAGVVALLPESNPIQQVTHHPHD